MRITPFIRELTAEEAAAGNVAPDGTFVGAGQTLREIRELHGGDEFDLPVVRVLDELRDRYGDRPVFASPLCGSCWRGRTVWATGSWYR